MKKEQLLKAGWVTVNGDPHVKVAHNPKTFRTPAPRYPKYRIRSTWGYKDGEWKQLENKVNMDELDAVYGKVPEGTNMTITVFTMPDGGEDVPDSDVEVHIPKSKKDEASLRAEAESVQHLLSHRPKNPFCPVCQRAKMYAPHARRKGGSSTVHSKGFGDHITIDHIITKDAKDYGFEGQTVAHVVKDVFTKFRYVYPADNKSGEQCYEDLLHFFEVDDNVKVVYSDNAHEFDYAVKQLQARHNTSREYVDQNKAVIEREIRTILEGTRANLVQSGLPDQFWPLASQHHAISLNVSKRLDNGLVPWNQRFGSDFQGVLVPFGAKILYWADPKQKQPKRSKFAGTGIEGIFLGYHIQPGFVFKEEYLVAPLQGINEAIENDAFRTFRAKRLELLEGKFQFPLSQDLEALGNQKPPELDDQHHNAVEERNPHQEEEDFEGGVGPLDEGDRPLGGSARDDIVYPARYDPLDDVPFSVRERLAPATPSFKTKDGIGIPYGYRWDGERLIKQKGLSSLPGVQAKVWSKLTVEEKHKALAEHQASKQAKVDEDYNQAIKHVPAMPVLYGKPEDHRKKMCSLYESKLLEIAQDMYAVVAKILSAKEIESSPEAQAALDKEWKKLVDKGCWVEKRVREYDSVAAEARKTNEKVHFGKIFEIGTLKGSELKENDPNRRYKGRSVFQGNKVLDENSDHALFAEMSSSPASMEAGKILDVFGSQPGFSIQQADARQAYTQALFTGVETWVRLPRNRWPKGWRSMKDPVVPLKLALYGHPDSGGIWERHCETELKKVGFEPVLTDIWKSVFYNADLELLMVIYVDDFKLAGPTKNIQKGWESIATVIDMDPAEVIGRYFGCQHIEEKNVTLSKEHHPFHYVFEPENETAAPAKIAEDRWDVIPEVMLAVRHHSYPRKRLYMPTEEDVQMFPTIGPQRYTFQAADGVTEEHQDNMNIARDKCFKQWWTGTTYFDLAARGPEEFGLAVAAARKGKSVRNKAEAKKEVKQNKFVTLSRDQEDKPGSMTKPVTRITYDMKDFLHSCVDRYCELAKVDRSSLKSVSTPFHELRTATPIVNETEKTGRLQPIASKVLMKILFAARMARWDLLRATQSLASRVTKWSPDCDLALHRLVSYINSSIDLTMSGFIGDSIHDCRLWLFSDADFAGEYDSKSTTGCALFLVGPNTYYPINAFSKKQTSITMSSTESEVVSANQGVRAQGLPSLSLWYFLWRGKADREVGPRAEMKTTSNSVVARIDPELDEIRYGTTRPDGMSIADINGLHVQLPKCFQIRHLEDNQATITLLLSGRAGVLRHTDRTQKVSFGWLRQQYEEGHFRLLNVDTSEQVADVFTKPFTERTKWIHALKLIAHTYKSVDPQAGRNSVSKSVPAAPKSVCITTEQLEHVAKLLRRADRYDFEDFEQVAEMMYDNLRMSSSRLRSVVRSGTELAPKYFVFGLWTHGGCFGLTKRTGQMSQLCRYINGFIRKHAPKHFTWTSFVINFMGRAGVHSDKFNLRGSQNWSFGFGPYQGGELWVEDPDQRMDAFTDKDGKTWFGRNLQTCRKPVLLNPHLRHAVQPFTGNRHSLIAYSSGGWTKLGDDDKQLLQDTDFRTPRAQLKHACVCSCASPHDEGGKSPKTTPETVASVLRASIGNAQTYTTCTSASVEPAVPTLSVLAGSLQVVSSIEALGTMSRLVAHGAGYSCDTGMEGRPLALQGHLNMLVNAGLSVEYLQLQAGKEYDALLKSYEVFPPQTIASLSLNDPEIPTPNLLKLARISNEGLSKLQPTERLRRSRFLLVVTDSVTSLGRQNTKGQWKFSIPEEEIFMAALTLRYTSDKLHMCWGKTLSWLTWQVQEEIQAIRAKYGSECEIDVIVWWSGNEVAGRRGCIPTRLAPGAAYSTSQTSAEDVARKVRRCADALATLAGEPHIGFVRIVGNVDHETYNLHPAYNEFISKMFDEFTSRGLQVQNATSQAMKLSYYDDFHLWDTPENRKQIQDYIYTTALLGDLEREASRYADVLDRLGDLFPYVEVEGGYRMDSAAGREALRLYKEVVESGRKDLKVHKIKAPVPVKISKEDTWWEVPDANTAHEPVAAPAQQDKTIARSEVEYPVVSDVSEIDEVKGEVVQAESEKAEYLPLNEVVLADDGDYRPPLASDGRATSAATRKGKSSGQSEDVYAREMYQDASKTHGGEESQEQDLPMTGYWYNGELHDLEPLPSADLRKYEQRVNFRHGDLKLLSLLLRGHQNDWYGLDFDIAMWTDVDKLLDRFNEATRRKWGVRQLLQVTAQDKKRRFEILGIRHEISSSLNLSLFPVRIRAVTGHSEKVMRIESDEFLARRFLTDENLDVAPQVIYHRTDAKSVELILKSGIKVAGGRKGGRAHAYFSPTTLKDEKYTSGLRSTQPFQIAVNLHEALRDGLVFFENSTRGILTRAVVGPQYILSCVDTNTNKVIYARAGEAQPAATREGEPDTVEQASSSSTVKALASRAVPEDQPKRVKGTVGAFIEAKKARIEAAALESIEEQDEESVDDQTQPAQEVSDTEEAESDSEAPYGSYPCSACQRIVLLGQRFCMTCGENQFPESNKASRQYSSFQQNRRTTLLKLTYNARNDDLLGHLRGIAEKFSKQRGSVSLDALIIRDAKDKFQRARKLKFDSIADRLERDATFFLQMMRNGITVQDACRMDLLVKAVLPDPGRTEEQRLLQAGSNYLSGASRKGMPGKLVYYGDAPMDGLKSAGLIDQFSENPIGMAYGGAFIGFSFYADIATRLSGARTIYSFNGIVEIKHETPEGMIAELQMLAAECIHSAEEQERITAYHAAKNRETAQQRTEAATTTRPSTQSASSRDTAVREAPWHQGQEQWWSDREWREWREWREPASQGWGSSRWSSQRGSQWWSR